MNLLGNRNYTHPLLKIKNNRKLQSIYDLLLQNPNIKRINEKPIALQWINSNYPLSDTTDISDIFDTAEKSKTKISQNNHDNYKIKTSDLLDTFTPNFEN